jgi:hypothetical protein
MERGEKKGGMGCIILKVDNIEASMSVERMREKREGTHHTLNTKRLSVQPSFRRQILDYLNAKKASSVLISTKGNPVFERGKIGRSLQRGEKRPDIAGDCCRAKKARYPKHEDAVLLAQSTSRACGKSASASTSTTPRLRGCAKKTVFFAHSQTRAA